MENRGIESVANVSASGNLKIRLHFSKAENGLEHLLPVAGRVIIRQVVQSALLLQLFADRHDNIVFASETLYGLILIIFFLF